MTTKEAIKQLEELTREREYAYKSFFAGVDEEQCAFAKEDVQALDVAIKALTLPEPDEDGNVEMAMANEMCARQSPDNHLRQYSRMLFVHNLGLLLRQTSCGVVSCDLEAEPDCEYVIALYERGGKCKIDVTADSYMAIIKDVLNAV